MIQQDGTDRHRSSQFISSYTSESQLNHFSFSTGQELHQIGSERCILDIPFAQEQGMIFADFISLLFKWWLSCLDTGGWKRQKEVISILSVTNLPSGLGKYQTEILVLKPNQCVWECHCWALWFVASSLSPVQAHAAVQYSSQAAVSSWLTRDKASQRGHGRWNPCLTPRGDRGHLFLQYVVFQPQLLQMSF